MHRALLLSACLATALAACGGDPDTVVQVDVPALDALHVSRIDVQMVVGAEPPRHLAVHAPDDGPEFSLVDGTAFTVQVPRELSGALDVALWVRDVKGQEIARGAGQRDALAVGELNRVKVAWLP